MIFTDSLKKNSDFQNVYRNGKSCANRYLVMYTLENGTRYNRLGISVSKKVGNSVIRHRIKRLVKESYRMHETIFKRGFDLVIIARVSAKKMSYLETESAVLHLGNKLHVVLKQGQ